MLFLDKYKIKNRRDACFHDDIIDMLYEISTDNSLPNILFYGPDGSGKKTLVNLLLKFIFGNDIYDLKIIEYNIEYSSKVTKISTKQSLHHMIINADNNNSDKYIIQQLVKLYARQIHITRYIDNKRFKIIVIYNIENLSEHAQMALRRTMETCTDTCRFVFTCNEITKVTDPLKSRCIAIRVPNPTNKNLLKTILTISCRESYKIELNDMCNIIEKSHNNISYCIILLEGLIRNVQLSNNYDDCINDIINLIFTKDLNCINDIENKVYEILMTTISGSKIILDILISLLKNSEIKNEIKNNIIKLAGSYENNYNQGRRGIIHIMCFITNIIISLCPSKI